MDNNHNAYIVFENKSTGNSIAYFKENGLILKHVVMNKDTCVYKTVLCYCNCGNQFQLYNIHHERDINEDNGYVLVKGHEVYEDDYEDDDDETTHVH